MKHFVSLSDVFLWQELNWDLAPITASSWLSIYMQLTNIDNMEDTADNFVFPKYSVHEYIQISRVSLSYPVVYTQLGLILLLCAISVTIWRSWRMKQNSCFLFSSVPLLPNRMTYCLLPLFAGDVWIISL